MAVYPAIARRLLEQPINEGNLDAIDQIMPTDGTVHVLFHRPEPLRGLDPRSASGRDVFKSVVALQRQGIEGLHVEIDQFLDAGHTITALCTLSGTGPGGRSVSWNMVAIMHLHDSKVAEMWVMADMLDRYRQLGLVPESIGLPEMAGMV
jgi:hypothetical protein